jgi:autotransporter-associated beta strand protein
MQTGGEFIFEPENAFTASETFRFNSAATAVQHSAAYATGGVADFRAPSGGGTNVITLNLATSTQPSTAQLTVAGSADWRIAGLAANTNGATGGSTAVNLNGGSLTITGSMFAPATNTGVSRFNFDGGTLRAGTNSATFFSQFTAATVYDGGGTIDTAGFDITVAQPLLAASGSGVSSIAVTNGGSGYISPPVVLLSGGGGAGATAVAILDEATGTVSQVVITNSGTGYTSAPSITLVSSTSQPPTSAATFGTPSIAANATTGGITKSGAGRLTLTGTSTYAGATSVTTGMLWVNGRLANTSGVSVSTGATLGGTGSIAAAISGSGLVSPGMSPGITTATQVNPSGGLDFAFEFTATGSPTYGSAGASVNDVLRITNTGTPFTASFGGDNVINVYFDVAALAENDAFRGGFYTDSGSDFISSIQGATYAFWVKGNGGGGTSFNGVNYYSLSAYDPLLGVDVATVAATANFGSGNVNGRVTEFTILAVVPEPSTLAALAAAAAVVALWRRRPRT